MNILLLVLLVVAFITDAFRSIIPNKLTLSAAAAGVIGNIILGGWAGLLHSAAGLVAGFMVILLLYSVGALGAGDVKLFAAIGAISGTGFVWYTMMYSIFYAGFIGLLILLWKRQLISSVKILYLYIVSLLAFRELAVVRAMKKGDNIRFPFMYAVLPGAATAWLYSMM